MEEEEGGPRLSKRFSDKGGEVDFKTKAGTAWSHSYLNQKPWHPLSYPNQRRKWIAEQTHAQRQRRAEEVSREFAQEQEFFRQTALVSKKEKEKMEMMKAVSFMYVRPPGYNAESAKAAEIADERKQQGEPQQDPSMNGASTSMPPEPMNSRDQKKKPVPKDVFGRALPTEEQFEVLKNAPRLETGVPARVKPFGVEVRNVKCLRCGNYGHQSGDRECPLKDVIMPNEESRLKRDDPLTAMLAHTDSSEPLKWELKQKPGLSPPRGGFNPDDPNQQIVAEDIFDEYGGFLGGENISELLVNFSSKPKKSRSKKRESKDCREDWSSNDDVGRKRSKKRKHKRKKHKRSESGASDDPESDLQVGSSDADIEGKRSKKIKHGIKKHKYSDPSPSDDAEFDRREHKRKKHRHPESSSSDEAVFERWEHKRKRHNHPQLSDRREHKRKRHKHRSSSSSDDADFLGRHKPSRHGHFYSSEDSGSDRQRSRKHHRHRSHHRQST
ncbi:hypothetical protein NMG60_11027721 [Bertholletia excelsa]